MKRSILDQFNKTMLITVFLFIAVTVLLYVLIIEKAADEMNKEIMLMHAKEVRWELDRMVDQEVDVLGNLAKDSKIVSWVQDEDGPIPEFEYFESYLDKLEADYFFIISDRSAKYYKSERTDKHFKGFESLNTSQAEMKTEWYSSMMAHTTDNPFDLNMDMNAEEDQMQLWINYTVFDPEGNAIGGVGISVPYEEMIDEVLTVEFEDVEVFVVDESGSVQLSKDQQSVEMNSFGKGEGNTIGTILADERINDRIKGFQLREDKETNIYDSDTQGIKSIIAAKVPNIDWSVLLIYKGGNMLSLNQIILVGFVILASVMIIVGISMWLLRTRMVVPVEGLIQHVNQYRQDGKTLELTSTGNEIDALAEAIQDLETEHQEHQEILSKKLEDRETEIHGLYASMKNNEKNLRRLLDSLPIGVIRIDSKMEMVYCNVAAFKIFGVKSMNEYKENRFKNPNFPFESRTTFMKFFSDIDTYQTLIDYKLTVQINPFKQVHVLLNLYPVIIDDVQYYEGIMKDITKNLIYERQLIKRANYDNLTGVLSRSAFITKLDEMLRMKDFKMLESYFVTIDFDCFKKINDTYGHIVGDKVLKKISEFLNIQFSDNGLLGRIGGDEFAGCLDVLEYQSFVSMMQSILDEVAKKTISYNQHHIQVTISIGATKITNADDFEKLYYRSDQALYKAKELGKNMLIMYDDIEKV